MSLTLADIRKIASNGLNPHLADLVSQPTRKPRPRPPLAELGRVTAVTNQNEVLENKMPQESQQMDTNIELMLDSGSLACVVRGTHEGEPIAKQRARFTRAGHVYTPGATKAHQAALAAIAKSQLGGASPDAEWEYGIRAIFYVQTHHRKDVDNLMKSLLDAMNRVVFRDDAQVTEVMGWKRLDCLRPRTEFLVYRVAKIDRESGQCIQCGKSFRRYKSWKARLYCSRKCNSMHVSKSVEVPCVGCGKVVLRLPSRLGEAVYCSGACHEKQHRRECNCAVCGAAISRPLSQSSAIGRPSYCSRKCYDSARAVPGKVIRKSTFTPEQLAEIARKGWETRRSRAASN